MGIQLSSSKAGKHIDMPKSGVKLNHILRSGPLMGVESGGNEV